MKTRSLVPAAIACGLGLAALSAGASPILYGDVVPATDATRTVAIDSSTRWVNVGDMETVKFVSNGREFAVNFDGVRTAFPLESVAPAGTVDHHVEVYVTPSALDTAGG